MNGTQTRTLVLYNNGLPPLTDYDYKNIILVDTISAYQKATYPAHVKLGISIEDAAYRVTKEKFHPIQLLDKRVWELAAQFDYIDYEVAFMRLRKSIIYKQAHQMKILRRLIRDVLYDCRKANKVWNAYHPNLANPAYKETQRIGETLFRPLGNGPFATHIHHMVPLPYYPPEYYEQHSMGPWFKPEDVKTVYKGMRFSCGIQTFGNRYADIEEVKPLLQQYSDINWWFYADPRFTNLNHWKEMLN